jgi:hypothetical protein
LLAVLVALTVSALVVGVSTAAAANAGNAANAMLCQKGGWRDLVTSTGAGFASEWDCVSYAAHGGTPLPRYQYLQSQYQAICAEHDGLFFLNGEAGWGCRSSVGSLTQDSYGALSTPCQEAGGTPSGTASHGEYFVIYCDSILVDRGSPPAPGPGGDLPGPVRLQVTVALTEARVLMLGIRPVELELSSLPPRSASQPGCEGGLKLSPKPLISRGRGSQ